MTKTIIRMLMAAATGTSVAAQDAPADAPADTWNAKFQATYIRQAKGGMH